MRFTRAIVAALLLAALVPTSAQDGLQPYFSLSSNRTYAPGDKPQIQMWSQNVEALEFRVYRVNDPVAFYRNLEDAQGMRGGRRGRPEPQVTWIERIHVFKQRVRRQVSDAFRAQYTPDSRAAIRDWLASRRRAPVSRVSSYADLPLLNPQQVVAVWRQNISRRNRWESETIPVDVKEKGLYLVEAAHGELRAYTVVVVTGLAVVSKTSAGRILAFAVNNRTGAPVPDCPLFVLADRQELARARTGADGLADIPLAARPAPADRCAAEGGAGAAPAAGARRADARASSRRRAADAAPPARLVADRSVAQRARPRCPDRALRRQLGSPLEQGAHRRAAGPGVRVERHPEG